MVIRLPLVVEVSGTSARFRRTPYVCKTPTLNSGMSAIPGPSFSDYYIFPDGELLPLGTTLLAAEGSGFEVRDVECLREHYVLTLRNWLERLESRREEACGATGDRTYRLWRLYLAGAAHKFRTGRISVYQTLLSKPFHGNSGLPLTRGDWYVS